MKTEFHLRRFTLEARSPLMVSNGGDDPLLDVILARDVNGLPMVPASGIVGALRALLDEEKANAMFGFQDREKGACSALIFSDALYHWKDNYPRDGITFGLPNRSEDGVVAIGLEDSPTARDHVRLNSRGVVNDDGKFNRPAVPRGARFTFEMSQWGDGKALDEVATLVRAGFWLGGATRAGFGEVACVAEAGEALDLQSSGDWERYVALVTADLGSIGLLEMQDAALCDAPPATWVIEGQIEGPLLIGGPPEGDDEDRAPYRERWIDWSAGSGQVADAEPVLPASAIKGPLRHRTYFHLQKDGKGDAQGRLNTLFGHASDDGAGQAGRFRFHDVIMSGGKKIVLTHAGLDRFTGGTRKGVLFTDKMLWQPKLRIEISCVADIDPPECDAFQSALKDMQAGLLGIGAEWGEGAGVFGKDTTLTGPGGTNET